MSQRPIEAIYQQISSAIVQTIHEPWTEATVVADLTDDTGSFTSTYRASKDGIEKEFDIDFDVYFAFDELRQLLHKPGHDLWQKAKFTLQSDGQFDIEFTYPEE